MPIRTRRSLRASEKRASNRDALPDNRLAIMDHALFAQHSAIDRNVVIQVVWVYEDAVDLDGVRRFNRNLGAGLVGRRIERSPLPFARHRWVAYRGPADIDIAEHARPRAELSEWADERAQIPTDPESGPGWRVGVLPLADGSTAVSLVISHYLIDGFGLAVTIADAVLAKTQDLGYPPPMSRTPLRAMAQDARQTAQNAREVGRALVAAAKLGRRRHQNDGAQSPVSRPAALPEADAEDAVDVPVITVHVDLEDWEARAKALGGTSDTLVAGFAAKLGERMGRRRADDGAVTLQLPVSKRTDGDTRAIAVSYARINADPTPVTTDLRDLRAAVKQALRTLRETPDESLQLLWLAPFMPKRTLKRMAEATVTDPDLPVFCSNLGDLGLVVYALARTDAEASDISGALYPLHLIRVIGQGVTRQWLERAGGQMALQSWRIGGKIAITIEAYQPGADNTKQALRTLAARTLAEFDLTGDID